MWRRVIGCFFIFIALFLGSAVAFGSENKEMKVHYIDVGQGDSILIETPNDKVILIDGGPPEAGDKIVTYLQEQNVREIDLLIATHPDFDHIGGLIKVMQSFPIKQIVDSGKLHTTKTYIQYINQIRKNKIPVNFVNKNERLSVDPQIQINVLNSYEKNKSNNQSSIVLKLTYETIDFLFMGDIERRQELKIMEEEDIQSEIIKVAHHGSKTSSSLSFLQEVNPSIALLTYHKRNKFGHPVSRVIENLNKVDAQIYSTAVFGNVVIVTNGKDYFVLPEKSPIDGLLKGA